MAIANVNVKLTYMSEISLLSKMAFFCLLAV